MSWNIRKQIREIAPKLETVITTEVAAVEASSISVIDMTKTAKTTMRMIKEDKMKEKITEENSGMRNDQTRPTIFKHLLAMMRKQKIKKINIEKEMNEIIIKKSPGHQRKKSIISDKVDQEVACKTLVRFIAKEVFQR